MILVSNTPQGKFLEGGAFDESGNFWFVAIGSGWVSYLTPEGKLVPGFNCNPPPEYNMATLEGALPTSPLAPQPHPTGFRWGHIILRRSIRDNDQQAA